MINKSLVLSLLFAMILFSCTESKQKDGTQFISDRTVEEVSQHLKDSLPETAIIRIEKGIQQVARLWRESDGTTEEFKQFCFNNFYAEEADIEKLFNSLSRSFEILWGNFNKISVDLKEPVHMDIGELHSIDYLFAGYSASSHFDEDMYSSQIAFITSLNFPQYTLKEKEKFGKTWNSKEWAYARMGDVFTERIPSQLKQKLAQTGTNADTYISEYYIWMDKVQNEKGKQLFDDSTRLITHWNLRDQLKADYALENGLEKQEMIYTVMKHIINQTIPVEVIDNPEFVWRPNSNKLFKDGKEIEYTVESDTRYEHLLNNFIATKEIDPYTPDYPNFIARRFESNMEIPKEEVEQLFIDFISSDQVKEVAKLITKRLGRDLRPFDIWYNGFSSGSSQNEGALNKIIGTRYPNVKAFDNDIPTILQNLGFENDYSTWLGEKIRVDASRGAGHAWGAAMKSDQARLRTNIPAGGMNYKGFNIAMHELGHNVEQTISLHNTEYYMMNGVPNTAFTEAVAFIFQKRDMQMLGFKDDDPMKEQLMALDIFWSCYEIMGVSLVDIYVWEWLYENPDAIATELKDAVINIAKDVWNKYYAEVFGTNDEPILAIYSHMIDNPLYLSAYPIGYIIDFQLELYLADKDFADEIIRIYSLGRLIPQIWMEKAVGTKLSVDPLLEATSKALTVII